MTQRYEHQRTGTAKLLALFHLSDGDVRVKGVRHSANTIHHSRLKTEFSTFLAALPDIPDDDVLATKRTKWVVWEKA